MMEADVQNSLKMSGIMYRERTIRINYLSK